MILITLNEQECLPLKGAQGDGLSKHQADY